MESLFSTCFVVDELPAAATTECDEARRPTSYDNVPARDAHGGGGGDDACGDGDGGGSGSLFAPLLAGLEYATPDSLMFTAGAGVPVSSGGGGVHARSATQDSLHSLADALAANCLAPAATSSSGGAYLATPEDDDWLASLAGVAAVPPSRGGAPSFLSTAATQAPPFGLGLLMGVDASSSVLADAVMNDCDFDDDDDVFPLLPLAHRTNGAVDCPPADFRLVTGVGSPADRLPPPPPLPPPPGSILAVPGASPAAVRYFDRVFAAGDFVEVLGADGSEFYGVVAGFLTEAAAASGGDGDSEPLLVCWLPDVSYECDPRFVMEWLMPDRERFEEALVEGRDFVSVFRRSLKSTEPLSCISRVFYSNRVAYLDPPAGIDTLGVSGASTNTYYNFELGEPLYEQQPQVGELDLLDRLRAASDGGRVEPPIRLDSTTNQILNLRMAMRFHRYAVSIMEAVRQDWSASRNRGGKATTSPTSNWRDRLESFAVDLLGRHFLAAPKLPQRLLQFLQAAARAMRPFSPERFGWCPVPIASPTTETQEPEALSRPSAYPFHLERIVLLAHSAPLAGLDLSSSGVGLIEHEPEEPDPPLPDDTVLASLARLVGVAESVQAAGPGNRAAAADDAAGGRLLVTDSEFAAVFSDGAERAVHDFCAAEAARWHPDGGGSCSSDSSSNCSPGAVVRLLERAAATLVARLMTDYLATVLHQASSAAAAAAVVTNGGADNDDGEGSRDAASPADPLDALASGLGMPRRRGGTGGGGKRRRGAGAGARATRDMAIDTAWGGGGGGDGRASQEETHGTPLPQLHAQAPSDLEVKVRVFQFVEQKVDEELRRRQRRLQRRVRRRRQEQQQQQPHDQQQGMTLDEEGGDGDPARQWSWSPAADSTGSSTSGGGGGGGGGRQQRRRRRVDDEIARVRERALLNRVGG
ncbi:hypothetical protein HK405_007260, partial [Cladochytrium tenue]